MEPAQLTLLAIIFGAYLAGSTLGFGTSMLVVTFGAQLFPLHVLLAVVAPLNISVSSYLALRHRRQTAWPVLGRRILPLVALGVPFGLLLFNLREVHAVKLAFGLFVMLIAAVQLRTAWSKRPKVALPRRIGTAMLFGGGVVHGLFGTGGPLIVYVVGREIGQKGSFRSTLATMWVVVNSVLFIDYLWIGLYDERVVKLAAMAIVPVVAGVALGETAHARLDPERFKSAVWLLLFGGGIILSLRAMAAL